MNNPIFKNYWSRILYVVIVIFITAIQTTLVYYTTELSFKYALTDSFVFNLIFAGCVVMLWYPIFYIRWNDKVLYFNAITHIVLIILLLLIWLGTSCLLMDILFGRNETYLLHLKTSLLWKIIEGTLFYIITILSYFLFLFHEKLKEKEKIEFNLNKLIKNSGIERIAVKNRQEIHVISIQDINYIEACGDYVNINTPTGSFLKEKTMKYFEENLPSQQFVRIHRSHIVNVTKISKIELYEKESYRVYLKDGKTLKASCNGYKILKEIVKL